MQIEQEDNCRDCQIKAVTRNCNIHNLEFSMENWAMKNIFYSPYDQNWFEVAINIVQTV